MSDVEDFEDAFVDIDEEPEPEPEPGPDDAEDEESDDSDDGRAMEARLEVDLNNIASRVNSMDGRSVFIVHPEMRQSSFRMTVAEMSRVISVRSEQIEKGEHIFTEVGDLSTPTAIAEKELREGRCPLVISRTVATGPNQERIQERFRVRDMTLPAQIAEM